MKPDSLIPVLYSEDIRRSIAYYRDILGFQGSWEWDEDPSFGGVDWEGVRIFFCKQGQGNPGTWLCINLDDVDEYYGLIRGRGAKILSPPDDKPWSMREMLVQDPDGHVIRFGQNIDCG
jgi:catechol 2,3-dioxygenase-like lactoylglutathione lyase family enzyme